MSVTTCHWFGAELIPTWDYSTSSSLEVFRIWDSIRYPLSLLFNPKNWKENVSIGSFVEQMFEYRVFRDSCPNLKLQFLSQTWSVSKCTQQVCAESWYVQVYAGMCRELLSHGELLSSAHCSTEQYNPVLLQYFLCCTILKYLILAEHEGC